jgi:hypothetical protein
MSGANLARARLAGAGRFLAVLAIAYVGVFRGFALSEQSGGWAGFALAVAALVAAGAMSGRWTALAIPFLLACVGPGLKAGGALVEGQLYESDPDDSDGRSNAALAVVGLILGLAAAVPATVPVAAGVLLRRLASRALRSRREDAVSPSGRTRWGYPAQGVVIAVVTALVFGGTALATALAEPPPTSGGNSPAPPVSCPGVPPFEAYYVGSTSGGLPLDEATRSCEAGGGSVGFEYGDCDSCRDIPLEIHTMPTCEGFVQDEQNLDLLSDGRDPQDDSYVRTRILGAPAVRIDGGSGASLYFEVYTGSTAISIDGSSRRHVERAVRALRRVPGKYVPLEDSEPLDEFEPVPAPPVRRLRPPPPGLFEGKVCTAIAEARERRLERKREGRRGEARGALDER